MLHRTTFAITKTEIYGHFEDAMVVILGHDELENDPT